MVTPNTGGLKHVSISGVKFGQMNSLFQSLREADMLKSIDISNNNLGDQQCKALMVALTTNEQRADMVRVEREEKEREERKNQEDADLTTGVVKPVPVRASVDAHALGTLSTLNKGY